MSIPSGPDRVRSQPLRVDGPRLGVDDRPRRDRSSGHTDDAELGPAEEVKPIDTADAKSLQVWWHRHRARIERADLDLVNDGTREHSRVENRQAKPRSGWLRLGGERPVAARLSRAGNAVEVAERRQR